MSKIDAQGTRLSLGRLPVSAFIITYNEADRVGQALESVKNWVDDIVVVDSGSTDGTQDICAQYGARVIHHPWPGYGPQKRFAESQCIHPWVLNLDADEWVTPALEQEIRHLWDSENGFPYKAYRVRVVFLYGSETRPAWGAYASRYIRLYHRDYASFADSLVHDAVQLNDPKMPVIQLRHPMWHRPIRSLYHLVEKFNRYTLAQTEDAIMRGRRSVRWRLYVEGPISFFKFYILQRMCLSGRYGFIIAVIYAFQRFLRMASIDVRQRESCPHPPEVPGAS